MTNIPLELRLLPQWVGVGSGKMPLDPNTGRAADVTNSATWSSYELASSKYKQVGFVFTASDPYVLIDLDKPETPEQSARHEKIFNAFQSYAELSQSGNGVHIIARGHVPEGRRRDKVEVYASGRYGIFTGNVLKPLPIADAQELISILYGEMDSPQPHVALVDKESPLDDLQLFEMALHAANGDKFDRLCRGEWQNDYPSQSEADFALLSIIAYYTKDNEQVRRFFRMSALGKRDKASNNNKYLDRALEKIRAKQPPDVDISAFKMNGSSPEYAAVSGSVASPPVSTPDDDEDSPHTAPLEAPPGLVGDVARYIYESAIRPVPEIAVTAAIAFLAGITGRTFNISGSGLNQYIILLAPTGSGKEGAGRGIDNLLKAVRLQIPGAEQFLGPSAFASGQGLVKKLDEQACFVSILGEFGLTLQQMCAPNANSALVMLRKVLLDIYAKSGWGSVLRPTVYSDKANNTKMLHAPNVTILGESTAETFFDGLSIEHIAEGLIPRFSVIEYRGQRPAGNKNSNFPPSPELISRLADLMATSLYMQQNNTCMPVAMDDTALALTRKFDIFCDKKINQGGSEIERQLWNRAHLKVLKLSALLAVGVDYHKPCVTQTEVEYALEFVQRDVKTVLARFKQGEVGRGEHRIEADIRRWIDAYFEMSPEIRFRNYNVQKCLLDTKIIPFGYLRRRLRQSAAVLSDRRGVAKAITENLLDLVKAEILVEIPPLKVRTEFGINAVLYVKGPQW